MAHNLVETSTFDSAVSVPDPGDNRTAASIVPAFQALANRTQSLKNGVSGAFTVGGMLTVNGGFVSQDVSTFIGDISVFGIFAAYAAFNAQSTFFAAGAATFGSTASFAGTVSCNGVLNINSSATLSGAMVCAGGSSGRVIHRSTIATVTGNVDPTLTRDVYIAAGGPAGPITLTIVGSVVTNDEIEFVSDSAYNITIDTGSTTYTLSNASGQLRAIRLKYITGQWRRMMSETWN